MPGLMLGDTVPNLAIETTHGKMKLHDFIGDSWTILFSHPGSLYSQYYLRTCMCRGFHARSTTLKMLLGLSCDEVESHKAWIKDVEAFTPGAKVMYPVIADPNREIIKELNMVEPEEDASGKQVPSRALHIVGPDKKIKLSFLYPASTGRNMEEVVRVLDSLQRATKHKIATPCNWKPGEPVVISPSVSSKQAKEMFP
ncbi:hypothetical protein BT93_L3255 [Corymbia citriodora subsp. variegata]|uniref:Peroxiredoxin n=1 Tax=Corymbia citriodora subsp. variegata TaxID=360336 RepID=A0A8T0CHU6_CORYI|nr:hypothetical protein BT93_L3255 [Corymbia citriodora subsp. variegata]